MGTNYYAERNVCNCCGRGDQRIHLGKRSMGWRFCFHYISEDASYDGQEVNSFERMQTMLQNGDDVRIFDECGRSFSHRDFFNIILDSYGGKTADIPQVTAPYRSIELTSWRDKDGWPFFMGEFC